MFILLSQIWFSFSGIGRQVGVCAQLGFTHRAHTYKRKPVKWSSTFLKHSFFLGDSWGFFHVVMCPVSKGLNSCQRGEGIGGNLSFGLDFPSDWKPLGALWQDLDQNALFMYPQLSFWGLDLSYNLPHLTEPVESSQNQSYIHFCGAKQDNKIIWSSLCTRINPLQCCFEAVCYVNGGCAPGLSLFACMVIKRSVTLS